MTPLFRSLLAVPLVLAGVSAARAQNDTRADDEKLLKAADVATDGPGLLAFFRKHTPTPEDQKRVEELVRQLGDKAFRVREKAAADIIAVGATALPALREVRKAGDLETSRRADHCIKAIEARSAPAAVAAAARLLAVRRPDGACKVLFDYLPLAADDGVAEDVLEAVYTVGVKDGKIAPVLLEALKSPVPAKCAAAALVVGRFGTPEQRGAVRRLLEDDVPLVRLRAAQGLLHARDRAAVRPLIALLGKGPLPLAQQAEDLLGRLAGDKGPAVALGDDDKGREASRKAWADWWEGHKEKLDLAKLDLGAPFANQGTQARTLTRRFLDALLRGDVAAARKMVEVPFAIDTMMVFKTMQELELIFQAIGQAPKKEKFTYKITKVVRLTEYVKESGGAGMKPPPIPGGGDIMKQLPRPDEVRAVYVDARENGRPETAAILVRMRGARATVVGLGTVRSGAMKK